MVSEIHTKQTTNEENSRLFMNSVLLKGKTKVETSSQRNLKIMSRNLNKNVLSSQYQQENYSLVVGRQDHRVRIGVEQKWEGGGVSALSAGAYTTTQYVIVDIPSERGWAMGMQPPPSPGWANFSIMMECTPESDYCLYECTLLCGLDQLRKKNFLLYLTTRRAKEGTLSNVYLESLFASV